MAELLVTGGTGVLGREAVPALRAAGHKVGVLSREPGDGDVVGDLSEPDAGARLGPALAGVETVLHLASSPRREVWETDVGGTRRLAVAAREAGVGHLLLVSVPGADDVPYSYNHAKYAAEEVVAASGVPYTVLRATQFHPFLALLLQLVHRGPVLPVGRGWPLQPVDTGDVAAHLVELVAAGPATCCPPRTPRAAPSPGSSGWPGPVASSPTRSEAAAGSPRRPGGPTRWT